MFGRLCVFELVSVRTVVGGVLQVICCSAVFCGFELVSVVGYIQGVWVFSYGVVRYGALPIASCGLLARAVWYLLEDAITLRFLALLLVHTMSARVVIAVEGGGLDRTWSGPISPSAPCHPPPSTQPGAVLLRSRATDPSDFQEV